MSPRADRSLVPANSPGPGWVSLTSQPSLAAVLSRRCVLVGVERRGGLGDEPVDDDRVRSRSGRRAGRRPSGHRPWGGAGSVGRPGGPARRGPGPRRTRFQSLGWRCGGPGRRPSGCAPRPGDMPIATARASGANAATAGCRRRRASRRRPARRARAAGGLDPGVGGGGVQDRPLVGELRRRTSLRRTRRSFGRGERRARRRGRGLRPRPAPGCRAHGTNQAPTTDSRAPKPLSTGVLRNCREEFSPGLDTDSLTLARLDQRWDFTLLGVPFTSPSPAGGPGASSLEA